MLEEIVFRENQESNSRYTTKDIPTSVLQKRVKWPTFPLNSLNYGRIIQFIFLNSNVNILANYVDPQLPHSENDPFWLVEVPIEEFYPIYKELYSNHVDLNYIDPKIEVACLRYAEYLKHGIQNKNDLIDALLKCNN